jgi:hypothetical protein
MGHGDMGQIDHSAYEVERRHGTDNGYRGVERRKENRKLECDDVVLKNLVERTPEEVEQWLMDNMTTRADLITVVISLAKAVAIFSKE